MMRQEASDGKSAPGGSLDVASPTPAGSLIRPHVPGESHSPAAGIPARPAQGSLDPEPGGLIYRPNPGSGSSSRCPFCGLAEWYE